MRVKLLGLSLMWRQRRRLRAPTESRFLKETWKQTVELHRLNPLTSRTWHAPSALCIFFVTLQSKLSQHGQTQLVLHTFSLGNDKCDGFFSRMKQMENRFVIYVIYFMLSITFLLQFSNYRIKKPHKKYSWEDFTAKFGKCRGKFAVYDLKTTLGKYQIRKMCKESQTIQK